jgi:hypothetical protein
MALLSGDDQRPRAFVAEYVRVAYRAIMLRGTGGFTHATHNRIGLVNLVLRVVRTVLARRWGSQVASFRARVVLSTVRRREEREREPANEPV